VKKIVKIGPVDHTAIGLKEIIKKKKNRSKTYSPVGTHAERAKQNATPRMRVS